MQACVRKTRLDQASPMARFLTRFARDESGVLVVFGVYVFLIMLMVGGIGIDLMRFERDRAKLQSTLDRAVLAAADLDQQLTPEAVVADYFDKAGLSQFLTSVTVDEGLGYRIVSGTAVAEIRTHFMHMTGIDTLSAMAASTAEERIGNVEISLVLDVSGSMLDNNRMINLQAASRDFIDDMMENTEAGKLSISIVPYAMQVSLPADFLAEFNISDEHAYSNCVNFADSDFHSTGISTAQPLERTMHFNFHEFDEGRRDDPPRLVDSLVCDIAGSGREVLIKQKNADTLKTFITNLHAGGNTSIDLGMKWGTALLDPSLNPVINTMIANGTVPGDFAARPHRFDDADTLKVVVLMSDGDNTRQFYVEADHRKGASNVWWNAGEQKYSIYNAARGEFYWPHDDSWNDHAFGNGEAITYCRRYRSNGTCRHWRTIPPEPGEAFALDYPDLWAYTSIAENMQKNYLPWMSTSRAWSEWYHDVFDWVDSATKDARTQNICNAAKDQGIIVFTIGFEAPPRGESVLRDCASSINHYFDVDGLELNDAFASIASSIRKLRLTQ